MDTMQTSTLPVNYQKHGSDLFVALGDIMGAIEKRGINRQLYHLVLLRASQMNGCGYCVRMHAREAREDGETNTRLDQLIIWRHSDVFTAAEKAAFAWTEALTVIDDHDELASLRSELRQHFKDNEIATLTATVAMINLWNRFQISNH